MTSDSKLLTFEWNNRDEQLEIHGTEESLTKLRQKLNDLLKSKAPNSTHLMTEEWGGSELTSEKQGASNDLINHVKIFKW